VTSEAAACARCDSPLEGDDLRCPICSQAVPLEERADRPEPTVEVLRCDGCGAAVSYSEKARAPKCAFCGSVLHLETTSDPMEQTGHFLPFTVTRPQATDAYRRWLSGLGFFRPSDLASTARLESLKALWWVGWVFLADALVSWAADSNAHTRKAPWAPHAGQMEMPFRDILVPATRGLSEGETAHLTDSYRLDTAREQPEGVEGETIVEQFDIRRSAARQRVSEAMARLAEHRVKDGFIPGSRFRNFSASILLRRLQTLRYAFPAYVVAYRYRGRLFRTVISGQDPTRVLGRAPYSGWKIAGAVGGAFLLIALIVTILSLLG
jgi:DNA-directed RNA polymerase subunit RPC12/RpoP